MAQSEMEQPTTGLLTEDSNTTNNCKTNNGPLKPQGSAKITKENKKKKKKKKKKR